MALEGRKDKDLERPVLADSSPLDDNLLDPAMDFIA